MGETNRNEQKHQRRKKMMLIILFLGLFAISTTNACGQCGTKHPQQHFCDADFAMKLRIVDISRETDTTQQKLVTAEVLSSWKRGPKNGEFQFYNPGSFCGTDFRIDQIYVVTGTRQVSEEGRKFWAQGSCDFVSLFDDMSSTMKLGFKREYAKMCEDCEVDVALVAFSNRVDEGLDNDYSKARTYWTPTNCYYNPHKSQQFNQPSKGVVVDCEDVYGVCAVKRDGQCKWKMTDEYLECFKVRDDYVTVSSKNGAFAYTDISQCEVLRNRRQRKNCRSKFPAA